MHIFQFDSFFATSLLFAVALVIFEYARRFLLGKHYADIAITLISVVIIALIDFKSLLAMIILSSAVYIFTRKRLFVSSVVGWISFFIVSSLIVFKSIGASQFDNPVLLVGISYYYFRLGAFVIEVGRGNKAYTEASLKDFVTWVFFFPLFLAGPIQRFHQLDRQPVNDADIAGIYLRIGFWLIMKIVVADAVIMAIILGPVRQDLVATMADAGPMMGAVIFAGHGVLSLIHGYIDLLSYTQIAIGAGALFGYVIIPNFNRPLLATSITDFWRRWHISLSSWARDYVYFPLFLRTRIPALATYATMLTIGLWHSLNLNWLFWALAHGTAIVAHGKLKRTAIFRRLESDQTMSRCLALFGWATTIIFVGSVYNLVAFPGNYAVSWHLLTSLIGLD